MPTSKDIEQQQNLLDAHRETLAHYLVQQARLGKDYAPPAVSAGIRDSRAQIARIKVILRAWNVDVEDLPDDSDENLETSRNIEEIKHLKNNRHTSSGKASTEKVEATQKEYQHESQFNDSSKNTGGIIYYQNDTENIFISDEVTRIGKLTWKTNDIYSANYIRDKDLIFSSVFAALLILSLSLYLSFYPPYPNISIGFIQSFLLTVPFMLIALSPYYVIRVETYKGYKNTRWAYSKKTSIDTVDAINQAIRLNK